MKKILKYTLAIVLGLGLCSCDKLFDSLEGDLTRMSEDDMTSSQGGMERLLSDVYNTIPMDAFNTKDQSTMLATYSKSNDYSINVTGFWNYTRMRSINSFIQKVDVALEKKSINEATRDAMLGEALFARAYCYFAAVRKYGGVPIVTEPLDQYYDGDTNEGLYIPRSTEKETWDFVISDLERAAELLPVDLQALLAYVIDADDLTAKAQHRAAMMTGNVAAADHKHFHILFLLQRAFAAATIFSTVMPFISSSRW